MASARITLGRSPRCRSRRSTVRSSSVRSVAVAVRRPRRDRALEHTGSAEHVDRGLLLELHRGEDGDRGDEIGDDEDPAGLATPDGDEPGELEHAERLAQRRLGDAELLGEHALVREAVAGAKARALDGLGEMLDRGLEGPGGANRLHLERARRLASAVRSCGDGTGTDLQGIRPLCQAPPGRRAPRLRDLTAGTDVAPPATNSTLDTKTETLFHFRYETFQSWSRGSRA